MHLVLQLRGKKWQNDGRMERDGMSHWYILAKNSLSSTIGSGGLELNFYRARDQKDLWRNEP